MAVKLVDLQVLYGVAGARDAFERLVAKLIKAEHPHAETVRVKKGDDGIDVYIGKFDAPVGIDVFQCKYFFPSVGPTQQGQIRKSFNRVKNSKRFKARTWTLCLPLDLAGDERAWFDTWKAKQAGAGIVIEEPWTALKLESLLCQERNRGLKEAYFKEEHLTQIREMHGMLQDLVAGLAARLREDAETREQTRQVGVLERQAQFVERVASEVRHEHVEALGQANRPGPQPALWEVVIHPSWVSEHPRFASLSHCLGVLKTCEVGPGQVRYPELRYGTHTTGSDWVGSWYAHNGDVECWHFAIRGVFAQVFTVPDDSSHQYGFAVDQAVLRLTQMFLFAKELAEKAFDTNDGVCKVTINLSGIKGRTLIQPGSFLRGDPRGGQDQIDYIVDCKRDKLLRAPEGFAIEAAVHFFERFKWFDVDEGFLVRLQEDCTRHF
jgi:hypothetical protein